MGRQRTFGKEQRVKGDGIELAASGGASVELVDLGGAGCRVEYNGAAGASYAEDGFGPLALQAIGELEPDVLAGIFALAAGDEPAAAGAVELSGAQDAELAELDRAWWAHEAQRAVNPDGSLNLSAAYEAARFRGLDVNGTIAALRASLAGTFEGTAAGGRSLLDAPGLELRGATRPSDPADPGGEREDQRIARLAQRYAEEHGVDLFEATVAVQKRGRYA
jgi:hypothetical protein